MLGYGSRTRCQPPVYPRNHTSPPAVALLRHGARWLAIALSLSFAAAVTGQALIAEPPRDVPVADDPGRFEVRSASTELENGVYLLTARVEFRLSSDARDALQAGVPLNI